MRITDSIKVGTLVFVAFVVFAAGGLELRQVARAEEPQTSDINALNKKVIEEFRANDGKVGGRFANATLLLLHTTGAKSGLPRLNPLAYLADGDRLVVIASKGGAPTHPDWYYNLVAHPAVRVEVGTEQFEVLATVATEPERTKLYEQMVATNPGLAEYEQKAAPRIIPVIVITRT